MSLIGTLTQFSANTKALAAEVNQNFADVKTAHNDLEGNTVKKDGSVAITGNLSLNNCVYLMGKHTSGAARVLAWVAGNNNINFGDALQASYVFGSSLNYNDGSNSYTIWHDKNSTASLATSGWQKLASGLVIQWGIVTVGAEGAYGGWYAANGTVAFPIAFPNACYQVMATLAGAGGLDASMFVNGEAHTTTAVTLYIGSGLTGKVAGKTVSYIAIGK